MKEAAPVAPTPQFDLVSFRKEWQCATHWSRDCVPSDWIALHRRAQKRFRERQKVKQQQSVQRVVHLESQLDRLELERTELTNKLQQISRESGISRSDCTQGRGGSRSPANDPPPKVPQICFQNSKKVVRLSTIATILYRSAINNACFDTSSAHEAPDVCCCVPMCCHVAYMLCPSQRSNAAKHLLKAMPGDSALIVNHKRKSYCVCDVCTDLPVIPDIGIIRH